MELANQWHDSKPFETSCETDAETGEIVYVAHCRKPIPKKITSLANEAMTAYREALDQCAYAVCDPNLRTKYNTYFPFDATEADARKLNAKIGNRSGAIRAEYFEIMMRAKPWRIGGSEILREIWDIRNPHAHTISVALSATGSHVVTGISFGGMSMGMGLALTPKIWTPGNDALEFFRSTPQDAPPHVQAPNVYLTFGAVTSNRPLHETLHAAYIRVGKIIGEIEALATVNGLA